MCHDIMNETFNFFSCTYKIQLEPRIDQNIEYIKLSIILFTTSIEILVIMYFVEQI